jgi:RNA polymerase sigma-54 factor
MKPSLQVRLSQHLALTPQLQQSIRLLQLSTLELQQEVEQMLEQNPFLEPEDDGPVFELPSSLDQRTATKADREADEATASVSESGGDSTAEVGEPALDTSELGTTARDDWENGTEADDFDGIGELPASRAGSDDDDYDPLERNAPGLTLQDHLREQVRGMRLPPADRAALLALVESLDDDGYLDGTIDEIVERLLPVDEDDDPEGRPLNGHAVLGREALDPPALELAREELRSRLRCALHWLQHLDPIGVGARNLGECLSLQLRARPACETREVALRICGEHLELLARRDTRRLMAATGADEDLLRRAQQMIVSLEPKPGRPFARAEANIVVPDVIVQKSGRQWKVVLNPDVMPRLRINELYAQAIRGQRGGHAGLSSRLQEARWFMKNILQRFDTIQRVSQAIVERQKGFFTHGEIAMKPLVLREIADELGLHESTISRVTTAKYMSTPFGTFELKYFFGSSLNTEAGGNASSTAVRALIKQLVAAEAPDKPLSDSQLSDMLAEQGIQVARRTVAKYREALKIAPANLRRAL